MQRKTNDITSLKIVSQTSKLYSKIHHNANREK
jgi:hypothetical protein